LHRGRFFGLLVADRKSRFVDATVFPTRTMFLNVIQGGIFMEGGA